VNILKVLKPSLTLLGGAEHKTLDSEIIADIVSTAISAPQPVHLNSVAPKLSHAPLKFTQNITILQQQFMPLHSLTRLLRLSYEYIKQSFFHNWILGDFKNLFVLKSIADFPKNYNWTHW
jgi:hypothetical protein